MKIKNLAMVLVIEAVLCLLAACLAIPSANALSTGLSFPFAQIGGWLRTLSLSGGWGNIAAILVYGAIGLVPLLYFLWRLLKKKVKPEDFLLVVMGVLLFVMMYLMVNPALFNKQVPEDLSGLGEMISQFRESLQLSGKVAWGTSFYSVFIGYLILKLLRGVGGAGTAGVLDWIQRLLALTAAILVFSVFYLGVLGINTTILEVKSTNTNPDISLAATNAFIIIRNILRLAPVALSIGLVLLAIKLAEALKEDKFGQEMVLLAGRLAALCRVTVIVTVICTVIANLLQLLFNYYLLNTYFSAQVPIFSLLLTLILLVLAQYFADSSKIHQDNQLFI